MLVGVWVGVIVWVGVNSKWVGERVELRVEL
jgi:hypothetical protein